MKLDAILRQSVDEVLATEYDDGFDRLRRHRMVVSYYKYGPLRVNYGEGLLDAVAAMEGCLAEYRRTGNTEVLADLANFAMIEHMVHPEAFDASANEGVRHAVGTSAREIGTD